MAKARGSRDQAVNLLKEHLSGRFGPDCKALIDAEVEGRLQGRSKLEREDLDAIERSVAVARRQRRGGKELKGLSRSVPDLKAPAADRSPAAASSGRIRPDVPGSAGRSGSVPQLARTASSVDQQPAAPTNPKKVRRPAPYATSVIPDEDAMSERSCVEVNPKHPVPLPPKLKPMDHWDLIVAFDTHKFRKEYEAYVKAGKHAHMAKFKNVLDTQMKEFRQMQDDEERARQQERQDMLNQVKENQRIAAAEKAHQDAVKDKAKSINEQSLESLRRRRKADEDRRQREQDNMLKWLSDENERLRQQRIADAEEYARKCKQAQDEMNEAVAEAARRKKARQDEDKAFAMAGEQAADDAEARNRAAVQARMDQIERNCQTIGADIAGRDARLEAELQAKIQKIQDDADQAAKEDAARRKADRDAKVKDMLDTLNLQMKQRDENAQQEKEDGIKQARLFQEQYEQGLAADRDKEEKARQARLAMDAQLVAKMRSNAVVHPRDFGAHLTQQQELAYNRGLYEQMAVEGFMMPLTSKFLPQATHTGKLDPHPSCKRYTGEIDPLEVRQQDI